MGPCIWYCTWSFDCQPVSDNYHEHQEYTDTTIMFCGTPMVDDLSERVLLICDPGWRFLEMVAQQTSEITLTARDDLLTDRYK